MDQVLEQNCKNSGDVWYNNKLCSQNPCNFTGACCINETTCKDGVTDDWCATNGYGWSQNALCKDTDCNTTMGRCCLGAGCYPNYLNIDCTNAGGQWDDVNDCTDVTCNMGVCCNVAGDCVIDWTSCNPDWQKANCLLCNIEETYPCCLPNEDCDELNATDCDISGGTILTQYDSCTEAEAVGGCALGACCYDNDGDETCLFSIPHVCDLLGGEHSGAGVECDDIDCGVGNGACCLPDGGGCVDNYDLRTCEGKGGQYQNDYSSCDSVVCGDDDCIQCEALKNRGRNRGRNRNKNYTKVQIENGECVWMMCIPPNCPYRICPE